MKHARTTILFLCVTLGMAPVAFIAFYHWDTAQNRDFEFGYFGDFNRVGHALTRIPGVQIRRNWANHDVTLEEFGYEISTNDGRAVSLHFEESDPLRDEKGQKLVEGLIARIAANPGNGP